MEKLLGATNSKNEILILAFYKNELKKRQLEGLHKPLRNMTYELMNLHSMTDLSRLSNVALASG